MQKYEQLCAKLKDISALQGINGLLGWDEVGRLAIWPVVPCLSPLLWRQLRTLHVGPRMRAARWS